MPETAFNSNITALLAGGAGFVGAHLSEALLNQGINVVCLDSETPFKKENITSLRSNPKFSFIAHDLNQPLPKFEENLRFGWVINLVGLDEIGKNNGIDTLLASSVGTYGLLELSKNHSARFVLVSSCDRSQDPEHQLNPTSYFGTDSSVNSDLSHIEATKFSQSLTAEYVRKYKLESVVLRVKDVFGPKMDLKAKDTLSHIVSQVVHGREIKLDGDGLEILNPTYIQDLIFGILKALHSKEAKGQAYYLVNPKTCSAMSVAEELKKLRSSHVEIETTKASHRPDLPHNKFNSSNSLEILGWQPRITLSEGLKKTIESFDQKEASPVISSEPSPSVESSPLVTETRQNDIDTRLEKLFNPKSSGVRGPKIYQNISLPKVALPKFRRSHVRGLILSSSLALVVLAIIFPIANLTINQALAFQSLEKSLEEFNSYSYHKASQSAAEALGHFKIAKSEVNNLTWLISLTNQRSRVDSLTSLITFSENLGSGVRESSQGLLEIKSVLDQPLGKEKDLTRVNRAVSEAMISLGLANRELTLAKLGWENLDQEPLKGFFGEETLAKLEKGLDNYQTIAYLSSNLGYLDSLLGLSKDRATALLFTGGVGQQNQEVFLAVLKATQAKITPFYPSVEGVNADLSQNSLEAVRNLSASLEEKLHLDLSGVVVVDRASLKNFASILDVSYNEEGPLEDKAKEVLAKLVNVDFPKLVSVLTEFQKLAEQKHVIASIDNTTERGLISQKVLGVSAESQEGDYLYFTATSLTPPKNDPKLSFRYRLSVDDQGEMKSGLSLSFAPKSESRYLGEIKVYYPKGSVLGSVFSSNGEKITTKKVELTNKTMYTFNAEVVDTAKTIDLEVRLPYKITTIKSTPYRLFIPKQPGADQLQGELVIELPKELRLLFPNSEKQQVARPYRIPVQTDKDFTFQAIFSSN